MIKIADRFRPFSHTPGAMCMVPGSNWALEAHPTEFRFVCGESEFFLNLGLTGPVEGFTLEQDLERNVARVFGKAKEGYYHFQIGQFGDALVIRLSRGKSIPYTFAGKTGVFERGAQLEIASEPVLCQDHVERLSLGMNKKLDWDLVVRRGDLREILPVLFFLGQKTSINKVNFSIQDLELFVKNQFYSILVPSKVGGQRLGLKLQEIAPHISNVEILNQAYQAIRALFIQEENGQISILPALPKEFVFGRALSLKTSRAIFDLEWSKRKLFKVKITGIQSGILPIVWPKDIDAFRFRHSPQKKGKMVTVADEILISPGETIYLDKFQK